MTALNRKEPDRVPIWELIVNEPTLSSLYGPVSDLDFVEKAGLDAVTIFENQRLREEKGGAELIDEWGIRWGVEEFGIPYPIEGPIRSENDLDGYQAPSPDADHRLDNLKEAVRRFKGKKAIVFLTHDAFEFSANLRGMDNLLMDYALNPEFAHRVAQVVIEYKAAVEERAIDEGADAIVAGDDYAWRKSPLMSPDHFREFVLPYLQQIVEVAVRRGVPFIKHTDGNIWPLLDMIVDTGISALDPLEPLAGMDIGKVKEKYGDLVAVVGNVDCTEVLCHGSEQEVIEAVKETIAKGSPGGGHILASSNSIHPGVKPENYRTMLEAGREYGRYPLDSRMVEEYRGKSYVRKYLE